MICELNDLLISFWSGLGWPLLRLIFLVSLGLLLANFVEALNWTHAMARLASPLVRLGNLSDVCGASFSLAFFSGVSGNVMLGEAYDQGRISRRELVLANLFNSLPVYFLHLPNLFFITMSLIKGAAFVYVGLTLGAAVFRTASVLVLGRFLLPRRPEGCVACHLGEEGKAEWRQAVVKAWQRFRTRIRRIILFTAPIYVLFFFLTRFGFFTFLEQFLASRITFLSWLHPEAFSIVVFYIAAEFTVGLAAAGALLETGTLGEPEIILALLVGNILSSPVRAVRHQFPFYAGIFSPRLAVELIVVNQLFRAASLVLATALYFFL